MLARGRTTFFAMRTQKKKKIEKVQSLLRLEINRKYPDAISHPLVRAGCLLIFVLSYPPLCASKSSCKLRFGLTPRMLASSCTSSVLPAFVVFCQGACRAVGRLVSTPRGDPWTEIVRALLTHDSIFPYLLPPGGQTPLHTCADDV